MHKWVFSAITIVVISILVLMIGPTITAEPPLVDNSKTISGFGDNVEIIRLNHIPGHHGPEKGSATLTGADVVPLVVTDTTGTVKFSHNKASDPLKFRLVVKNGIDVTLGHIHCAGGNVGKTLFNFEVPVSTGKGGKALASGKFTTVDGGNTCVYLNFQALLVDMRTGTTYIDVHTGVNSDVEIRGSIIYS